MLRGCVNRLTDNKEVQIYPMGAERYLSSVLSGVYKGRYNIKADIEDKDVLVIPGFGNSGFLLALAGAKSVTIVDKDPVTIAWIKAFKTYYHYKEGAHPSIGELLAALTRWFPPLITLPEGQWLNAVFRLLHPNALRRVYIHYMLKLVRQALESKTQTHFELEKNITIHTGEISQLVNKKAKFDTAFVPYLLGVRNGIEKERDIVHFMRQLLILVPKCSVLVNPSQNKREFHLTGKRYFETTPYENIQAIPELQPYFKIEDKYWFRTQGLAVFAQKGKKS